MTQLSTSVRTFVAPVVGSKWLRLAGGVCIAIIAVLSLVPRYGPGIDNGAAQGPVQHFVAYLVAAALIGLGARQRQRVAIPIVAFAAYAGLLELLQFLAPGREPGLDGFLSSSLGAVAGTMLAFAFRQKT